MLPIYNMSGSAIKINFELIQFIKLILIKN